MGSFTRDWNESAPDGTDDASSGDDEIRNLKVEISDRLKNMLYGLIAGENSLAQHFQYLQLYEQSSVAQPSAGFGRLYLKAVSGNAELFWHDEDGNERQLTSGGVLLNVAGDYGADSIDEDDIQLDNNAALTALNAAGDGTVNLILAGTNDLPTLPDSAEMASNAAPTEDEGIANKKYVDDQFPDDDAFGAWATATQGSSTQAASDGFIVLVVDEDIDSGDRVTIKTDSSNPPTTLRAHFDGMNSIATGGLSLMCPVKKNDYYLIEDVGLTPTAYWLPVGG